MSKKFGEFRYDNGSIYMGELENGLPHGKGVKTLPMGIRMKGTWVNGKKDGYFRAYQPDGMVIESEWSSGQLIRLRIC